MRIEVVHELPQEMMPKAVNYVAPSEQTIFAGAMDMAAQAVGGGPTPEDMRAASAAAGGSATATVVRDKTDPYATVGRNDPCPCGSGKKFKKCHGATQ